MSEKNSQSEPSDNTPRKEPPMKVPEPSSPPQPYDIVRRSHESVISERDK